MLLSHPFGRIGECMESVQQNAEESKGHGSCEQLELEKKKVEKEAKNEKLNMVASKKEP